MVEGGDCGEIEIIITSMRIMKRKIIITFTRMIKTMMIYGRMISE